MTKTAFLVVDDYGMGAIWAIIHAGSREQIATRYPWLRIVDVRPAWMDESDYAKTQAALSFDIDDAPHGWLLAAARDHGYKG